MHARLVGFLHVHAGGLDCLGAPVKRYRSAQAALRVQRAWQLQASAVEQLAAALQASMPFG